jgi:hypothetical protein
LPIIAEVSATEEGGVSVEGRERDRASAPTTAAATTPAGPVGAGRSRRAVGERDVVERMVGDIKERAQMPAHIEAGPLSDRWHDRGLGESDGRCRDIGLPGKK